MKRPAHLFILAGLLTSTLTLAQTPTSGKITYEGMRQIDRSQMRMVINGQEVRPGSPGAPDAPEGLPDVMSFTQKLVFSGTMAKEERDRPQNMMVRRTMGGDGTERSGPPRETRLSPPFEQTTFLDLANRQRIDVMTIKNDSVSTTYRTERPMPSAENWQPSDKTKKIAGYLCHKATATASIGRQRMGNRQGGAAPAPGKTETYTVWYTTDLPFTYSPVAALTPEKGVVLQIESDNESYKATSVSTEAVAASAVQPPADAKAVSTDDMEQIRRKAMADFRQKMMSQSPFPGRN
ncbi:GLPGLI family protein [Spirosoma rigui]|uniref:GLPGLI family protein n=1 Tax=Spirosoma rigui TaxID=564064 RepID=UPI0009AFA7E5|nr:GLPGLI family protein [Spirosoma rigui]